MTTAYPLEWPAGWERNTNPTRSNFSTSPGKAIGGLYEELSRLGATSVVVSTNIPVTKDGRPYANHRSPEDPGVAAYFELNGREQCIPCDKWDRTHDNAHAIALCVRAMRGLERWGAKTMVDAAFRGFEALPPGTGDSDQLNRVPNYFGGCQNIDQAKERRRVLRKELHPDLGGSAQEFSEMERQYKRLAL